MSALRSAGTNRPSSVSTAMPMSTCGCSVRVSLSPSNQALSAGHRLARGDDRAHQARGDVVARRPRRGCRHRRTSVVGTTFACASAMTRAMLRRTPLSCSGWPLAADATAAACASACRLADSVRARARVRGAARRQPSRLAPARAARAPHRPSREPSAAARFTSSIVTTPSAPLARTRAMSTPSLRAMRAHRRHRLDAADRERLFAAHRVRRLHRADHGAAVGAFAALRPSVRACRFR